MVLGGEVIWFWGGRSYGFGGKKEGFSGRQQSMKGRDFYSSNTGF